MVFHSQPRFTKHLDFFIKADPANARAVYAALAEFGVAMDGIRAEEFADPGNFFPSEDLIASKLASGRTRDLADAEDIRTAARANGGHEKT